MTREEAITKAMKLLKLAESTNAHEAALAAQRAQEILQRFNITHDILEAEQAGGPKSEPIEMFGEPLDRMTRACNWKSYLASVIANANQCRVYIKKHWDTQIVIVGGASDAQVVRYFYTMLCGEVERLAKANKHRSFGGKTWLNNFRLGVVDAIATKLKEGAIRTAEDMKAEVAHNPAALAKIETALARRANRDEEILDWMKKYKTSSTRSSSRTDYSARVAGQMAGADIAIGNARGALNAARPQINQGE